MNDVACVELQGSPTPRSWREMSMVMIPKPGKDHKPVKGWRPIALANTIGKLADKLVAE